MAAQTVEALKSSSVDALIFPFEWADVVRTLMVSQSSPKTEPSLVVVASQISTPILARSLACGFHGAVEASTPIESAVERIASVVAGTSTLESEPALRDLGLSPGLLARELVFRDSNDRLVSDLVATGLTDDDIALAMGWTIQKVRNQIEHLLSANELTHRTQLAVIRASLLKVPDFS
jgi:DNA-binding NarL/FixJ family response regulator